MKATSRKQKRISFSLPPNKNPCDESDDDEEDESEHPATIHVAIRKDASLYKINHKDSRATLVTHSPAAVVLTPPSSPTTHHDKNTSNVDVPPITRVYMVKF